MKNNFRLFILIFFFLGSLTPLFGVVDPDPSRPDCKVDINVVARATYSAGEIYKIVEERSGLGNIASISLSCTDKDDDPDNDSDLYPVELRFILYSDAFGKEVEDRLGDFVTSHDDFDVVGSADINGDGKLYVRLDGTPTVINNSNINLEKDAQLYDINQNTKSVDTRIADKYGKDLVTSFGGLVPEDTYYYKVRLYGPHQDFRSDVFHAEALGSIVYLNPDVKNIFLQDVTAFPDLPVTFLWNGIDDSQIRKGVGFYYKLLIWNKDDVGDKENAVGQRTLCPVLDGLEITQDFFEYPTQISECADQPFETGQTYFWQVQVFDEEDYPIGENLSSEIAEFTVGSTSPPVPQVPGDASILQFTAPLRFAWTDVLGAEFYNVYLAQDEAAFEDLDVLTPIKEQVENTEVSLDESEIYEHIVPGVINYWMVQALDERGDHFIEEKSIASFTLDIGSADSGLQDEVFTHLPSFRWNTMFGAKGYRVYIADERDLLSDITPGDFPDDTYLVAELDQSVTEFALSSLEMGGLTLQAFTQYYISVIPVDQEDRPWGQQHDVRQFSFEAEFYGQVETLNDAPPYQFRLNWQHLDSVPALDGLFSYQIEFSKEGGFDDDVDLTVDSTDLKSISVEDINHVILPNQAFYWRIQPIFKGEAWGEAMVGDPIMFPDLINPELSMSGFDEIYPLNPEFSLSPVGWQPSKYMVFLESSEGSEESELDGSVSGFSFSDLNIEPLRFSSTYKLYLVPVTEDGAPLSDVRISIDFHTPDEPNFSLEWNQGEFSKDDEIAVAWTSPEIGQAVSYTFSLYSSDNKSRPLVELSMNETSALITPSELEGLGKEFIFTVRATLENNQRIGDLQEGSFVIGDSEIDIAPSLSSPEDGESFDNLGVVLSWDKIHGVNEYRLELSSSKRFSVVDHAFPVQDSQVDISGLIDLEIDQPYYWRVSNEGAANYSEVRSFKLASLQPELVVDNVAGNLLKLSWQGFGGLDSYQLKISSNKNFSKLSYDEKVFGNEAEIDLKENGAYYAKITTLKNGAPYGDESNIVTFEVETDVDDDSISLIAVNSARIERNIATFTWKQSEKDKLVNVLIVTQNDSIAIPFDFGSIDDKTTVREGVTSGYRLIDSLEFNEAYKWRLIQLDSAGKQLAASPLMSLNTGTYAPSQDEIKTFKSELTNKLNSLGIEIPSSYELVEMTLDGQKEFGVPLKSLLDNVEPEDIKEFQR